MPFRTTFACLWCGTQHSVDGPEAIEGWAQLCPDCLGRAGDNGFLRFRLRAALDERGRARTGPRRPAEPVLGDDWYLRRGPYSRGAIDDALWAADLDAATLWLDATPLAGELVEPVAGEGWWSPLLAGKGELWVHDPEPAALDRARARLVAHGLRAHLHVRDPWAEPERRVDAIVTAFWLGRLDPSAAADWLGLACRWLRPGGRLAMLELGPWAVAVPADPRTLEPDVLASQLRQAGFVVEALELEGRILCVLARAAGESVPSGAERPEIRAT